MVCMPQEERAARRELSYDPDIMCGRYLLSTSAEIIAGLFRAELTTEFQPRYNIAPSQMIPVVEFAGKSRRVSLMRWGLTPSWAKAKVGPRGGLRLPDFINARSETASSKPSFRTAFRHRRCIVPADGFFEWKKESDGSKKAHCIRFRDRQVFGMAAIWEAWTSSEGELRQGVCVLTTQGNSEVKALHDRMPVVLHPDHYEFWLNPASALAPLEVLLRPLPDEFMEVYPVSNRVNKPGQDDADLLNPIWEYFLLKGIYLL
jgi:putative SOS response-associated peptidase YedK